MFKRSEVKHKGETGSVKGEREATYSSCRGRKIKTERSKARFVDFELGKWCQ